MDESSGDIHITTEQDLKPFLERMKQKRVMSNETWAKGVKEEWVYYAEIPPVVIMELRNKGIDIFNPEDTKKMLKEINANYKYLKTVDHKNHE
jgi:hypothetical protein